ncbi:tubulin glycylase 3D-like isoform X2 [Nymphalis io]|uniref:tubulin glycylase 3D-like isoform X2 n=1 Tax=Inachis io TaxID=171585 RepID=UPI00216AA989|nr:tubulin glycylase 3D-like isoform X2 [Nymphalis io]
MVSFGICVSVYFTILVKLLSGYLLFAANFDDFHTIAKKLVAENLPGVSARNSVSRDAYYDYDNDYERSYEIKPKSRHLNTKRKKAISDAENPQIDFEELVERVKKRIEKELKDKYINKGKQRNENEADKFDDDIELVNKSIISETLKHKTDGKPKKSKVTQNVEESSPLEDDMELPDDVTDKFEKDISSNTQIQQDVRYEYADAMSETTTNKRNKKQHIHKEKHVNESPAIENNEDMPFKKIIMSKKDSYEDYKIPVKETNIYSSSEKEREKNDKKNKRFEIEMNRQQKHNENTEYITRLTRISTKRLKRHRIKSRSKKTTSKDYTDKKKSDEFESKSKLDQNDDTIILSKETTKRTKFGTNIPTHERYMTVTPNYNARIPTLVERYDFDEPLPEKDRERENLKYYGDPSARINKKIRLI